MVAFGPARLRVQLVPFRQKENSPKEKERYDWKKVCLSEFDFAVSARLPGPNH
jgi:hypothetical protein